MEEAKRIGGTTKVYGLIGHPIGHTFSPLIHNTLASLTDANLVYTAFPVEDSARIGDAMNGAFALGVQGLNVTVPYKSAVIPFLADIDPIAREIGAVNTLVRTENGYKGYNTDYIGLRQALESEGVVFPYAEGETEKAEYLKPLAGRSGVNAAADTARDVSNDNTVHDKNAAADGTTVSLSQLRGENLSVRPIHVRNVVLIGAGGAARAAGFMCGTVGLRHLTILNRTVEKAQSLANDINRVFPDMEIRVLPLSDAGRVGYEEFLAIQCTNVGLYPHTDEIPTTSTTFYRRIQAAYDCIYNPEETQFLAQVHRRGKRGWCGIDMLLWQGIAAYQYWTGITVTGEQAAAVRSELVGFLQNGKRSNNIVLAGFMGSGKSTIGEALAKRLGWQHMDTDELIVQATGKTISQIFRDEGEEGFRTIETKTLQNLVDAYGSGETASEKATATSDAHTDSGKRKAGAKGIVFSTGGGIVLQPENRALLRKLGRVVLLDISAETVVARLGRDHQRPLLQGPDRMKKVRTLLSRRQGAYHECADVTVEVDDKSPDVVVKEIMERTGRQ
ncbi:shikimate kinase [Lachnospiraceae bacterium NK3A20]|nr:shikimate kinase [Lachnospiraceae bacterium NK3A20]